MSRRKMTTGSVAGRDVGTLASLSPRDTPLWGTAPDTIASVAPSRCHLR